MRTRTVVAAIVGIDGCGKSSTFRDALHELSKDRSVAGVGDEVLQGGPGAPLTERSDIPLSRSSRAIGGFAKGLHWQGLYKQLKLLELSERSHVVEHIIRHDRPAVVLTDGDPLTNISAWSVARFFRKWLTDDDELADVIEYMAGDRRISVGRIPRYTRRAWQLVLLNRLHVARLSPPDIVFLLEISPARAMERISARGRPLQTHENEPFLTELARAYSRICGLLQERFGVSVVRMNVDEMTHEEVVALVVAAVRERALAGRAMSTIPSEPGVDVIATTMSGSLQDQRKVGLIGPEFESQTSQPVRVHLADSHAEARKLARQIIEGGGRTVVSAGGAGTFNAVLEGAHIDGRVPEDLRLAFLRKGSADLIGKALHIPDSLPEAVTAIIEALNTENLIRADVLELEAVEPDGSRQVRHIVGFGGLGIFGEVPRFTESRIIKYYKGILGTLFGDLGPFYTGLVLAMASWRIQRLLGRVPALVLTLDGQELPPRVWGTVTLINGDLGKDFPLGRGLDFSSGTFRVVALRYRGLRSAIRQINACRTGRVLDDPAHYSALVRDVRALVARPVGPCPKQIVNVDGLRMTSRGPIHVTVAGAVQLVAGGARTTPVAVAEPAHVEAH